MVVYKDKYKGKVIFMKCYGQIDTNVIDAETIKKLSLNEKFIKLAKLIQSEKTTTTKGADKPL